MGLKVFFSFVHTIHKAKIFFIARKHNFENYELDYWLNLTTSTTLIHIHNGQFPMAFFIDSVPLLKCCAHDVVLSF